MTFPRPCERHHPAPCDYDTVCTTCWQACHNGRYQRLFGMEVTAPDLRSPAALPPVPAEGPGTELKAILESLGISAENCSCSHRAGQMNVWGVGGCRARRAEIVGWLEVERDRRGWRDTLAAGLRAIVIGLWLNPLDLLGSIVDEAIRRAEAKATPTPTRPAPGPS